MHIAHLTLWLWYNACHGIKYTLCYSSLSNKQLKLFGQYKQEIILAAHRVANFFSGGLSVSK